MHITFNELRQIKDALPDGSMHQIAEKLNVSVETVRNYFGGENYRKGMAMGNHYENGPFGGIVDIEDDAILEMARSLIAEIPQEKETTTEESTI